MNSAISTSTILIPSQPQLFFSKNDPDDIRLGDLIKSLSYESLLGKSNCTALLGYPDDEGIRLNGGRLGAAEAPKMIRQFLYKMTPSAPTPLSLQAYDLGDLSTTGELPDRHAKALQIMAGLHLQKIRTVSLGGGHDYGYSDTAGFVQAVLHEGLRPIVINFDAHLDVRPTSNGFNSGTPFFRLLTEFHEKIDFVEIGLQPQCNSPVHWHWAERQKAYLYGLKTIEEKGLMHLFKENVFKNVTKKTPVFVSFDIDALAASEAGGCSQAWMTGLKISECLQFLAKLYELTDVRGLGIYEVSPALDRDFQTSKTAALLVHHFLYENKLP